MKILVPVDGSTASFAAVVRLVRQGRPAEVLLLNVQPAFPRHISQFTRRAWRDELRMERAHAALSDAVALLADAGVGFQALMEVGRPAVRIAVVAERERVDEIVMGVGRHPAWLRWLNPSIAQEVMARTDRPVTVLSRGQPSAFERYGVPAGIAGVAALFLAAD